MADTVRIEELRRRVQMDPASIAFAALAEEYRRAGNHEEAIATCRTGLQRHPAYLSARVTLGRSLLETGRYEEARHELEFVLRAAPENLAAIRGLAEIHHRARDGAETEPPASAPAQASAQPPAQPPAPAPVAVVKAPPLAASPEHASHHGAPPQPTNAAPPIPARPPVTVPPIAVTTRPALPVPVTQRATEQAVAVAPRPPHPDEAALPALEAFLAAAAATRRSARRVSN